MPCRLCDNGKWRWGSGPCEYESRAECERANAGRRNWYADLRLSELRWRCVDTLYRWTDRTGHRIARRIPKRLRYWVVVDAYARASRRFPNAHYSELGYKRVIISVGLRADDG